MLAAMRTAVVEHDADLALGFDGDGDRCGVVDDTGEAIFADKIGLMLARDLAPSNPGAKLVVDVKSTGLYATDPVLAKYGISTIYWKTGHSYIKRETAEVGPWPASRNPATSSSVRLRPRLRLWSDGRGGDSFDARPEPRVR